MDRSARLARRFKAGIAIITTAAVCLILLLSPTARYATTWLATHARWTALGAFGIPPDHEEIDAQLHRTRLQDIEQTRGKLRSTYGAYGPEMKRLLDHAGLDPEHALLRWGNLDKTLYLPSTVFEADDTGRSYRFRPSTKSIWVRNLKLKGGILTYFPVPMTPELPRALEGSDAVVVSTSVQTTNSWGLRGPEPDTSAPIRGIVLGDSYMQGLFVGDDQTPAEWLKRELSRRLAVRTEILNTGHLGYSPEQEYYTLREYDQKFHPQFVVLSLFANDFGDLFEVLDGKANWAESGYWMSQIGQFCRSRGLTCLVVPAPWVNQFENQRRAAAYPGQVSNLVELASQFYLDPFEDFADELLRVTNRLKSEGKRTTPNPLFNGHVGDGHFSPLGCKVWARSVASRLVLLLESQKQSRLISY